MWSGFRFRALHLLRGRRTVKRILARAEAVRSGPVHDALREVAAWYAIPTPRLFLTDGPGPLAVGIRNPAVLVPRGMTETLGRDTLQMVLAHEAAHVARRDTLSAPLRILAVSAWCFHPVAWALTGLHRRAAEDACDDLVIGRTGRRGYCNALLAAARTGHDRAGRASPRATLPQDSGWQYRHPRPHQAPVRRHCSLRARRSHPVPGLRDRDPL
ncbi:MAG: M56 family metallopeptidase [Gemmatimonadota bacterium]